MAFVHPPKAAFSDQSLMVEVVGCSWELTYCEDMGRNTTFAHFCYLFCYVSSLAAICILKQLMMHTMFVDLSLKKKKLFELVWSVYVWLLNK